MWCNWFVELVSHVKTTGCCTKWISWWMAYRVCVCAFVCMPVREPLSSFPPREPTITAFWTLFSGFRPFATLNWLIRRADYTILSWLIREHSVHSLAASVASLRRVNSIDRATICFRYVCVVTCRSLDVATGLLGSYHQSASDLLGTYYYQSLASIRDEETTSPSQARGRTLARRALVAGVVGVILAAGIACRFTIVIPGGDGNSTIPWHNITGDNLLDIIRPWTPRCVLCGNWQLLNERI